MQMFLEGGSGNSLQLLNGEDPPGGSERGGWNIFWVAGFADNVEGLLERQMSFESPVQWRGRPETSVITWTSQGQWGLSL